MTTGLRPWHAVATPHADIREGRLGEAVFATNAWAVVQGTAPEVYLDPEELFRKTFMTAASQRCCGKWPGLTLWRLGRHAGVLRKALSCESVWRELGGLVPDAFRPVGVFTNRTCDAAQGRPRLGGIHTLTLARPGEIWPPRSTGRCSTRRFAPTA